MDTCSGGSEPAYAQVSEIAPKGKWAVTLAAMGLIGQKAHKTLQLRLGLGLTS